MSNLGRVPIYELSGRTALITGAARGIGLHLARQLYGRGVSVALLDLDGPAVEATARALGDRAIAIEANVIDGDAMSAAVTEVSTRFGGIDLVIPAAGVIQSEVATAHSIRGDEWERVFEVDFLGVWRTVRAALPQIRQRQGQIVLTSSIFAFVNGIFNSPYATAKAGGEALGRALRAELAPSGASATVAYFAAVETKLLEDSLDRPFSDRMEQNLPGLLRKRIAPEVAASAIVRGIENRSPRVFAPRWWRLVYALQGILMPFVDRRLERDETTVGIVRDVEANVPEPAAKGKG